MRLPRFRIRTLFAITALVAFLCACHKHLYVTIDRDPSLFKFGGGTDISVRWFYRKPKGNWLDHSYGIFDYNRDIVWENYDDDRRPKRLNRIALFNQAIIWGGPSEYVTEETE